MNKVFEDPVKAVADNTSGSSIAVGGFGPVASLRRSSKQSSSSGPTS